LANTPNKLDNRAHLAIILLVEESVSMLRYGRARHNHLHDLTILAALFTQVLYNLQVITTTPHTGKTQTETWSSSHSKAAKFSTP